MLFKKKKNSAYKTRTGQSISCPVFGEGLEVFEHEANSCSYSEDFKDTGFKKYVRCKQSLMWRTAANLIQHVNID